MSTHRPELCQAIYAELRALAKGRLSRERANHSLHATALVHEAYLRLGVGRPEDFESRAQFFAAAAEAMRRVLIDHARSRGREKRGGGKPKLSLEGLDLAIDHDPEMVLHFDDALSILAEVDERAATVVRLRFFAGLTTAQIAEMVNSSERTVRNDWAFARAWLFDKMNLDATG